MFLYKGHLLGTTFWSLLVLLPACQVRVGPASLQAHLWLRLEREIWMLYDR